MDMSLMPCRVACCRRKRSSSWRFSPTFGAACSRLCGAMCISKPSSMSIVFWQRALLQSGHSAAIVLVGIDPVFVVETRAGELRRVLLARVQALVVPLELLAVREVLPERLLIVPAEVVDSARCLSQPWA